MLPGFSFLLGLGSLFVASLNPTPRYRSTPSDFERSEFFAQCRRWRGELSGGVQVPKDYLDEIRDEYKIPEHPRYVGFTTLAANKETSVAIELFKYFEWKSKKEGVKFVSAGAWEYVNSIRGWSRPEPAFRKLIREEDKD